MKSFLHDAEVAARLDGAADFRIAGRKAVRLLGAFNTGTGAAEAMARWAVRRADDRILEPSFGSGEFLRAIRSVAKERGFARVKSFGAELIREPLAAALLSRLLPEKQAFPGDFLALDPFEVDAIIGNPPYVRLRHLPADQHARAMRVAKLGLGEPMETSGSVWMPFVLHALQFLKRGGRLALVLPYEFTYVRYARPLWRKLGDSFRDLRVVRVRERLFPEILQDVVLLFADGFGGSTASIRFQSFETAAEFERSTDDTHRALSLAELAVGKRAFLEALLPPGACELLSRVFEQSTPLPERCTFHIGYVAGDKTFFHPTNEVVKRYGLSQKNLRPAFTSSRQLKTLGLRTSNPNCVPDQLYQPLSPAEANYLSHGQRTGIAQRYKCRIREPWYVVPGVRVPDVVLSVFAERPVLAINDAGIVASNSLLCGYLRSGTAEQLAAAWYTSLTLLQCELQVHSLGGGVFILIPGEVAKIRLPTCPARPSHLNRLDHCLTAGDLEAAYRCGDEEVLQRQLGLSMDDVNVLRDGVDRLRHWRTSAQTQTKSTPN